jgi:azurin
MRGSFFLSVMATVTLALMMAGCGEGDSASNPAATAMQQSAGQNQAPAGGSQSSETSTGNPAQKQDGQWFIEIESNDQMQYDIESFSVKAGEPVKLRLKHVGQQPVEAMGHNVVITEPGTELSSFAVDCQTNGNLDNGYLPKQVMGQVIAHTQMLGGGESDTITFTAPEKKGNYPFLCTFPAHFATMNGTMTVK